MTVLYVLVPMALLLASAAVVAFLWAARDGQLDDLDTPPVRILNDDETTTDGWKMSNHGGKST